MDDIHPPHEPAGDRSDRNGLAEGDEEGSYRSLTLYHFFFFHSQSGFFSNNIFSMFFSSYRRFVFRWSHALPSLNPIALSTACMSACHTYSVAALTGSR